MYDYQGVVFTIDRETIDDSAISINSFSAYGIELFWADNGEGNTIFTTRPAELLGQRSENGIYYGTVKGAASAETQSARTINVVNTLAQTPGFVSVSLVREWAGIGFGWGSEKWENSDPQVAAMEVHGGYDNPLYVPHFVMDRTATVTGLKPGLTYITVKRNVGHPTGKEVSSVCPLYVYIPGDVDANGTVTTSDALQALQAAVGKIPLTETQTLAADIDGDKKISTADALKILQAAVGKIKLD